MLSGWTEDEAIAGLHAVSNHMERTAKRTYELCGGSIRNLLQVCQSDAAYTAVKNEIDDFLSGLTNEEVIVALTSTERSENKKSFDRVRTMFLQDKVSRATQIVDAEYILHELRRRIALSRWLDGYRLALSILDGTLKGLYFEKCVASTNGLTNRNRNQLKLCAGLQGQPLRDSASLWLQMSIGSNFPNIDSAVVVNDKLYALQITCTKSKKRKFDACNFVDTFVQTVRASFPTLKKNVNIIFLILGDSVFSLPQ